MRRSSAPTRSAPSRRYRATGPDPEAVSDVLGRAAGACERCGVDVYGQRGVDWSIHHRRPRQMGGTRWEGINLPSNLMLVCGSGTTGCHGEIERQRAHAQAEGWLVPSFMDPAQSAVLVAGDRWWYLGNDGEYHIDPPERAR